MQDISHQLSGGVPESGLEVRYLEEYGEFPNEAVCINFYF
jgi:hypothetical protein